MIAGDKPKSYSWTSKDGKINCCENPANDCKVSKLWEVGELTSFHDSELAEATKQINAILSELKRGNRDQKRELAFIQFKDRHFLVWTIPGNVGPHDDDEKIKKMLRLKAN
jgi:hypothetical protein